MPSPTRSFRDEIDPLPLALGALLVMGLVVQLARPSPAPAGQEAARAPVFAPSSAIAEAPDYPQILAHPLFSPARGGVGAGQAASTSLSDYTLAGIAVVGGRAVAVVRDPSGEALNLRAGEMLLGWRLALIGRDAVVLRQGDIQRTVPAGAPLAPKTAAP